MKIKNIRAIQITLFLVIFSITNSCDKKTANKEYNDPSRFENDIQNFEATDKLNPPPNNAIVCIGSSSIRGWHAKIHDDFAPLTIIARGFGGSNMNDALYYAERIVLPYEPRAIVIYEGDNDIAQGISPQKIVDTFKEFVNVIHRELPQCRIYFLSIKPSISRWKMWPKMKKANELIAKECAKDEQLIFVDISTVMLNEKGKPREEIFLSDNLHMNSSGYEIWTNILKPILLESELQHE